MILKNSFPAVLLILMAGCGINPIPKPAEPPNIILLSVDTLRADRLGLYGNNRSVSPVLDRLSREGHTFCSVTSQSPLTAPSHMTIFTSRYPEVHQVRNVTDGAPLKLSPGIPTLTEQLKAAGYGTVACTDGGNVNNALGFSRGFDMYGETGAEQFMSLVRLRPREPWFAFLHTYWVHDPYIVPNPYDKLFDPEYAGGIKGSLEFYGASAGYFGVAGLRKDFWSTVDFSEQRDREHLLSLYDGAIRMIDSSLQALVNLLDELGVKDNTILVVTSDHGEEFFEHSRILHERLYYETLQVPLIIIDFRRSVSGHLIESPVRLIDVAPTLLDYVNMPPLPGAQGVAVTTALNGGMVDPPVIRAVASTPYLSRMTGKGPWKYIFNPDRIPSNDDAWVLGLPRPAVPEEELYNIEEDPAETANLAGASPGILEEMRGLSLDHQVRMKELSDQIAQEPAHVDESVMSKLKALGYVE